MRNTFRRVLFWSVISAAFIGPGTVTTAGKAGAAFGPSLLWALLFSTLACLLLQEAAARLPLLSGHNLGQAIRLRYGRWSLPAALALLAILVGGVAYEAGNLLGAVAGAGLMLGLPPELVLAVLGVLCAALLWKGSYRLIANLLGMVVAAMGLAFGIVAFRLGPALLPILKGMLLPQLPEGSSWLVVGLIGTTIVPYNLFLGSGLSHGDTLKGMRQGLIGAVLLGGLISMVIVIACTGLATSYSFEAVAAYMEASLGKGGASLFGFGLFAAGFSSALTAPLAAAITVESILGKSEAGQEASRTPRGRWVWGSVLAAGLLFGLFAGGQNATPVAVIIAAQVLNGLLLPLVSILLLFLVNDARLLSSTQLNPWVSNVLLLGVVGITSLLGLTQLVRVGEKLGYAAEEGQVFPILSGLALLVVLTVGMQLRKLRRGEPGA
jgi:manganese transport protein